MSVIAQSGWVCVCFRLVVDFDDIVGQFDKSWLDSIRMRTKKILEKNSLPCACWGGQAVLPTGRQGGASLEYCSHDAFSSSRKIGGG